jgi:tetrahydromethanopterin S-methyltransferase subunit F
MTQGEQKMLRRGVAAGTLIGLAIGGLIALVIAVRLELFAALVQ